MLEKQIPSPLARRSFIARLGAAVAAFGGTVAAAAPVASAQSAAREVKPVRHAQDDWMDTLPGKHRLVFDTTTAQGISIAMLFANNYLEVNRNAYGLQYTDIAAVIVVRHQSTMFAYNDAIWAKYGAPIARRINFNDPKTRQAPAINVLNSSDYGSELPNNGITMNSVLKKGVHLAVCELASHTNAAVIADAVGGDAQTIYNELVANLLINCHMTPAGIVAVNRAQERGYSFVSAG